MKKLIIIDDFAKNDPIEMDEFFDSLMMTEVVYYDEEGGSHVFPADVFLRGCVAGTGGGTGGTRTSGTGFGLEPHRARKRCLEFPSRD